MPAQKAKGRLTLLIPALLVCVACGLPLRVEEPGAEAPTPGAPAVPTREQPSTVPPAVLTGLPEPSATALPEVPAASPGPSPTQPAPQRPTVGSSPVPPPELTNEQIWRQQQDRREVFDGYQVFTAQQPTPLWWYDPQTGQSLEVGKLLGAFTAQAQFVFRPENAPALEVPYRINGDFGLTAISPSVVERMNAAGYREYVETYVLLTDTIRPQRR